MHDRAGRPLPVLRSFTRDLTTGLRRFGPVDILSAKENRQVVVKLLRHVVALAVGPVGTYLLVRDLQSPERRHRDAVAAIAAVLVTNILIALYVVMAFTEKDDNAGAAPKVVRLGRWRDPRAE
mmetsp:Transcript_268/g.688  ORF Transcript_268/g.688 Transcript_268/m.688 type:complete len:123 (+) Transcript_268:135-503(+)